LFCRKKSRIAIITVIKRFGGLDPAVCAKAKNAGAISAKIVANQISNHMLAAFFGRSD
jgi:hypothetical protein